MTLRFSFQPSAAEHARVSTLLLRRNRTFWIVVGAVFLLFTVPVFVAATKGYSAGQVLAALGPYFFIFAFIVLTMPLWQRWALQRVYRKTPVLQQEQTHEFSEAGFRMSNPLSNTLVKWDALIDVVETREFFLLFIGRSVAYFVPKRAIPSESQLHELRALFRAEMSRMGRNARLLAA